MGIIRTILAAYLTFFFAYSTEPFNAQNYGPVGHVIIWLFMFCVAYGFLTALKWLLGGGWD